jgi:hypothetical protein
MCTLEGEFFDGDMCVIAQGLVHGKTAEKVHCVDSPEDLARILVTEVPSKSPTRHRLFHTWSVQGLSHKVGECIH